jgi:adenosylcobinamide-GDP ribazoletransferase
VIAGLRLAFSWLTVLPAGDVGPVDRRVAGRAIAVAPLVGALLGLVAAGVLLGLSFLHCPPLLAGLVVVGLLALLTRGMHLDGAADTADGLGCYGPPERALAVLKDGGAGPFGVVALIVLLGAQAASLAALAVDGRWWAVVLAVATGRAAFPLLCPRGRPAARPEGFGALVADGQPWPVPTVWWLLAAGAAVGTGPRWWQGPVAVLLAAGAVLLLGRHTARRFGGLVGDVLGAGCEVAVTTVLAVSAFG